MFTDQNFFGNIVPLGVIAAIALVILLFWIISRRHAREDMVRVHRKLIAWESTETCTPERAMCLCRLAVEQALTKSCRKISFPACGDAMFIVQATDTDAVKETMTITGRPRIIRLIKNCTSHYAICRQRYCSALFTVKNRPTA